MSWYRYQKTIPHHTNIEKKTLYILEGAFIHTRITGESLKWWSQSNMFCIYKYSVGTFFSKRAVFFFSSSETNMYNIIWPVSSMMSKYTKWQCGVGRNTYLLFFIEACLLRLVGLILWHFLIMGKSWLAGCPMVCRVGCRPTSIHYFPPPPSDTRCRMSYAICWNWQLIGPGPQNIFHVGIPPV